MPEPTTLIALSLTLSSALSAASSAGAFTKKPPKPEELPSVDSPAAQENRRKLLRVRARQKGHSSTILAGAGAQESQVRRPTLLGETR